MPSPNLGSSVAVASAAVASVASAAVASPKVRAMARARVRAKAWIFEPKAAPPPEPKAAPPPEPKAAPPPEPKAPPPLFEPKAAPPAEYSKFLADKDVNDSKFLACKYMPVTNFWGAEMEVRNAPRSFVHPLLREKRVQEYNLKAPSFCKRCETTRHEHDHSNCCTYFGKDNRDEHGLCLYPWCDFYSTAEVRKRLAKRGCSETWSSAFIVRIYEKPDKVKGKGKGKAADRSKVPRIFAGPAS